MIRNSFTLALYLSVFLATFASLVARANPSPHPMPVPDKDDAAASADQETEPPTVGRSSLRLINIAGW